MFAFSMTEQRWRCSGSGALRTGLPAVAYRLFHSSRLYAEALSSDFANWMLQVTLLVTATGFLGTVRQSSGPTAIASPLFSTVQMGLLGTRITFAGRRSMLRTLRLPGLEARAHSRIRSLLD